MALASVSIVSSHAQKAAIKTNLLYDATATFNVGAEAALSDRWTVDLSANYNPWTWSDNTKWKHWMVQPELRWWVCQRFNGHFFGLHLQGGEYNVGNVDIPYDILGTNYARLKEHRFEGWFIGAGLGYGYQWILSRHFNREAELGFGYNYTRYDSYQCALCGKAEDVDVPHDYVGVTKAALALIYIF